MAFDIRQLDKLSYDGLALLWQGQAVNPVEIMGQLMGAMEQIEALEEAEAEAELTVAQGQPLPTSDFDPDF